MEHPIQYLDEDDALSMIKINGLDDHQGKQVMVTCEYELSTRMVKNFFRKFGELESCQPYGYGQCRFVLTFTKKNGKSPLRDEISNREYLSAFVSNKSDVFLRADVAPIRYRLEGYPHVNRHANNILATDIYEQ